ncbi:MAG: calcium-binding protein [Myxococcaceae bacterium]|nr:calcium-binding protein [Myxococcaceae bacterium]
MKPLRRPWLTLSLFAVSLAGVACSGALGEDEAVVGEATSMLSAGEETGALATEASGAESDVDGAALVDESMELPSMSADSSGVCDLEGRRQRVMARYDENGDGQLGPSERRTLARELEARAGHPLAVRFGLRHRVMVLKRLKWAFDENGDGQLSTDERTALVDAMEARCQRLRAAALERFDANTNGVLDAPEREAAKQALAARVQAARQQVLAAHDSNQNGALDESERAALRAERVAAFRAKRAEVVSRFDVDGNGALDDAETLALKRAIQVRVAEGRDAE